MNARAPLSRRSWLGAAAAAATALGSAGWVWHMKTASERTQELFWQQQFKDVNDHTLLMSNFRTQPLVLNFWATWCPPCLEELPLLDSFFSKNASNGWQVVGLAADQDESVKRFLARSPLSYPVGLAGYAGIELSRSLGNASGGLPHTVFFDARGRLIRHKIGRLDAQDLDSWAHALASQGMGSTV